MNSGDRIVSLADGRHGTVNSVERLFAETDNPFSELQLNVSFDDEPFESAVSERAVMLESEYVNTDDE